MNHPVKEGARRQHDRLGVNLFRVELNADDLPLIDQKTLDRSFKHLEIARSRNRGLHRLTIELAVSLRARAAHGGAL